MELPQEIKAYLLLLARDKDLDLDLERAPL